MSGTTVSPGGPVRVLIVDDGPGPVAPPSVAAAEARR